MRSILKTHLILLVEIRSSRRLKKKKGLRILLNCYLEDRKIIIQNKNGKIKRSVFDRVPQGSIRTIPLKHRL